MRWELKEVPIWFGMAGGDAFGLSSRRSGSVIILKLAVGSPMDNTLASFNKFASLRLGVALAVLGLAFLGVGCAGRGGYRSDGEATHSSSALVPERRKTLSEDRQGLLRVNSVLIAPVQFAGAARSDAGQQLPFDQQLELSAARQLTIESTSPSKFKERGVTISEGGNFSKDALQAAQRLKLDGVLYTTVTTLQKRVGGALGADTPASLGFTMELVRAADQKRVWSASYVSHDEAISSNLLKISDKVGPGRTAGWLSLQEVCARGFDETLQDLSQRRQVAFSSDG